ncbi:MAG TPA: hypothetical protein VGK19_01105 [Capsulimonadaceae bacterium]|jgi:hypothetical protein
MHPAPEITSDIHKALAASLFNMTWTYIDKPDRTVDETDTMIHAAHASRYHWSQVESHQPYHMARGEWQISRVYAILPRPEGALAHAQRCLAICEGNGIGDFDIAYAHEAMARAYAAAGNVELFAKHYQLAGAFGEAIADDEDRELLNSDLVTGPWYGMDLKAV